ncbi:MAG: Uma2 family endonuclease [Clostridiales Family XIII bacterium]|jgi:Uma2 family endonuclease|nr:Uma2 family endonuclease [Clostridiales Family XIII bacterium]
MANALKVDEYYTYTDYLSWDEDERYELIDGVPYMMAPAPTPMHQGVVGEIGRQIDRYLDGKSCKAFRAPIDVRLNAGEADDTVVQPDLIIVCDKSKIGDKAVVGAPDMVIEVLSPSTKNYDTVLKLGKYMKAGVLECWLVDTENHIVRVHIGRGAGRDEQITFGWDEEVPVGIFPGFKIDMKKVLDAVK